MGAPVIERHNEPDGDEEVYVVLCGRVRFLVGEESFEGAAGTVVHVPPDILREAVAREITEYLRSDTTAILPERRPSRGPAFGNVTRGPRRYQGWPVYHSGGSPGPNHCQSLSVSTKSSRS